jgi:SPP1 family predicted phage head-tail adaptor
MSLRRLRDNSRYTNLSNFNQQITLLMPAADSLSDGTPNTPTTYGTTWAAVRLMRQQEIDKTELVQGAVYYDVRIPYDSNVNSQFTVLSAAGETWYIESLGDIDQRQVELKLLCRCVNDGGVTTTIIEVVEGGTF